MLKKLELTLQMQTKIILVIYQTIEFDSLVCKKLTSKY